MKGGRVPTSEARIQSEKAYRVQGVYLPLSRRVITADDSGLTTWRVMLRDHRLLEGNEDDPAVAENRMAAR
jgi:hypothetical protein